MGSCRFQTLSLAYSFSVSHFYHHLQVSHLILGHVSQANFFETVLRTLEVLFLSMDPTSGLLSVAVIGLLAGTRKALTAAHSRENETEADILGIQLAARACFDTSVGSKVMYKMNQLRISAEPAPVSEASLFRQLLDTHPPTLERYQRLQNLSETENHSKYNECATVATRLYNALWSFRNQKHGEAAKDAATTAT